ncbi:MAG: hypothetical protein H6765_03560 [Candidatus Peribacteria bacterium]|nr:MAG: hypothetical protein H6765_03560 [Candidatus Peribacteria bacterium]
MFVGFVVGLAAFFPQYISLHADNPFLGLLLGGGLLLLVSIIDELGRLVDRRFRVPPVVRLVSQITAIVIAFYVSGVGFTEFVLPGGVLVEFGPLSQIVLTVVWYLVFINAINFFDGIYGLASGMSSIGFMTITLLLGVVVTGAYPDITAQRADLLQ